ncbi:MAG: DUF3601 domain-containing protein [Caulobacteraceae bacterium]|nr:DUF3601 domain-containing protein [Caulobacteraceae bacterium]
MAWSPLTHDELALIGVAALAVAGVATVVRVLLPRRRPRLAPSPPPGPVGPRAFHQTMTPGREYMIVRSFTDVDGRLRSAGERWVFKGYDFLPYEDGLTLFTEPGPGVRLQWRSEAQGEVIDNLADYIRAI